MPATIAYRAARAWGFTLVELLVVISVATILLALAVPSLQNSILMNRADTASNQFAATLSLARSEAVKQGTMITVCVAAQALPCAGSNEVVTNWTAGWNECCTPDSMLAKTYLPVQTGSALSGAMTAYGTTATISFDALGRLPVGTKEAFIFCPDGADVTKAYAVTVGPSGRTRVVAPSAGQGPVNDSGAVMTSCTVPTS